MGWGGEEARRQETNETREDPAQIQICQVHYDTNHLASIYVGQIVLILDAVPMSVQGPRRLCIPRSDHDA